MNPDKEKIGWGGLIVFLVLVLGYCFCVLVRWLWILSS
jgi:hypothetical protein